MQDAIFLLSAATAFVSACILVSRRNPVYSVVFMLPFFLALTVLFVLLSAPFLAAMEMMVYGGAILVVFLFVIMLINLRPAELKSDFSTPSYLLPAALTGLLGALVLGFILTGIPPDSPLDKAFKDPVAAPVVVQAAGEGGSVGEAVPFGSVANLSLPLFQRFLVPFELVSLLIVVAILGVVVLAKKKL
jgi:NADH-quinone oxidoreductase subunit J